ncbi:MAG: sulfite exporter TauE/SafE family protein [Methylotenera sp.]|nr:sulfite exporter TauE/SafE family protein [Oligoflexia bacterium]
MDSLSQFLTSLLGSGSVSSGLMAVLIAYFGGVLSSLTPCIYPMIPITVSVVGGIGPAHPSGKAYRPSWKHLLTRGSAYVLGMTLIYSLLGVVAGLTGKVFGTLTNTSGWYIGLGAIMTLAALTMMDVIPFDPQMWIEQVKRRFGGQRKSHVHVHNAEMGFLGALTLGASSGFIAAPCTTPVLTVILAFIAKTQSVGLGLSLMIAFSLGLGTLLIVIATFAGALQRLPRSGQWMKTIKVVSGFVLLVFAQYLIFRAGTLRGSY